MTLTYNNKRENIEDKFKTFDDFLHFVKENIKNLNIENKDILSKIENIYISIIQDKSSISFSTFKYLLSNKMNFKFKNILTTGYWEERGHDNANEIVDNIRMSPNKINYWLSKGFNETDAKLKLSEHQKKCSNNIDYNKRITNTNINYYLGKGYSLEESKDMLSERQKTINLEKYVEKYGDEIGAELYNQKVENRKKYLKLDNDNNNTNINYYINKGYSLEESKNILSERQKTINLEKYVEKYGDEIGTELYNQKVENRNSYFGCSKKGYSFISQELFDRIKDFYADGNNLYYATNNKEYSIKKSTSNGYWLFDFTDLSNNKIIEFQGDIFHANPKIYKHDETPHPFYLEKKSSDIWREDQNKKNDAEKQNFKIHYVWYSEYLENKEKVFEDCIKFLK
jgi:ribosomal protein S16